MLYVKKGDKYWTKEDEWLNRIIALNLNDYLFDGDKFLIKSV